jgi:hypothetical protein
MIIIIIPSDPKRVAKSLRWTRVWAFTQQNDDPTKIVELTSAIYRFKLKFLYFTILRLEA